MDFYGSGKQDTHKIRPMNFAPIRGPRIEAVP